MTIKELKAAMKKLEMDYVALAELTGCDPSTVHKYIHGKMSINPFFAKLVKIAVANGKELLYV